MSVANVVDQNARPEPKHTAQPIAMRVDIQRLWYGQHLAVRDSAFDVQRYRATALIGPSGCGKSSVLRSLNRMNDLVDGFRIEGKVVVGGHDVYGPGVDPVAVRRHIGMVFQQPNPFVTSIFNNVAFGPRINRMTDALSDRVEKALRDAALWDEVKDKLNSSASSLSGGQQQRLCIARAIATEPEVLLMDEPCSALDPIATSKIEELILTLRERYTVVIVTHNLQQARRIADSTGFFYVEELKGVRTGYLAEFGPTEQLFENPSNDKTRAYIAGRFG